MRALLSLLLCAVIAGQTLADSCWMVHKDKGGEMLDHCVANNPVTRWVWRKLHGCEDCDCFCKEQGKDAGLCRASGNPYASSWCDAGFTCTCA